MMPLLNGRWPEIDTPVPWPVPVVFDVVAPGESVASALKLRAMVGRSSICLLVMTVASVLCVSTGTLFATTSIASVKLPTFIVRLTLRSWPTRSTSSCLVGAKLESSAVTSYRPGRRFGRKYCPSPPVTVLCTVLVSIWRTVTVTPGNAPPC